MAVAVRYGPWWLDSSSLLPDSHTRRRLGAEMGSEDSEPEQPPLPAAVYRALPEALQPLVVHTVLEPLGELEGAEPVTHKTKARPRM